MCVLQSFHSWQSIITSVNTGKMLLDRNAAWKGKYSSYTHTHTHTHKQICFPPVNTVPFIQCTWFFFLHVFIASEKKILLIILQCLPKLLFIVLGNGKKNSNLQLSTFLNRISAFSSVMSHEQKHWGQGHQWFWG